jgi:Mlc titration factor MtfA (ptsG expression regulator)
MIFSWLRERRRRKLLSEPFPVRWEGIVGRNVGHFAVLPAPLQDRLRDTTRILLAEKTWLGRGGHFITEEMRVTVAAQAALLLLGRARDYYRRTREVVVFPSEFRTPVADDDWEDDFLSDTRLAGQAVMRGTVLLAWDEVLREGREPECGHNVVIHEFAHQLDFAEEVSRGVPDLGDAAVESRWQYAMAVAYADHRRAVQSKAGGLFFTHHAADDEREFFADLTEAFYCRSLGLRELHPELYELLAAYYRLDPASWKW